MTPTGEQVKALAEGCEQFRDFKVPPDYGYRDGLALCVVDSVQSTGVTYASVGNVIDAYKSYRRGQKERPETDGTRELLKTFDDLGGSAGWADRIGNQNKTSTRAGAPLKAEAIRLAAEVLDGGGISDTEKLREAAGSGALADLRTRWLGVPGQRSGITWHYLLMLAGVPGVKPDRMIVRFVADTLGLPRRRVISEFAAEAVLAAARQLNMSPTDLDHGIWSWQRRQR